MKQDMRSLNQQTQYQLRQQVVRLKSQGRSSHEVAEITGLTQQSVTATWRKYQAGGIQAIKPKARGRRQGQQRRLSPEQEKEIIALTAVRLRGDKKVQNLLELCYEEIAQTHNTQGDFGHGSP